MSNKQIPITSFFEELREAWLNLHPKTDFGALDSFGGLVKEVLGVDNAVIFEEKNSGTYIGTTTPYEGDKLYEALRAKGAFNIGSPLSSGVGNHGNLKAKLKSGKITSPFDLVMVGPAERWDHVGLYLVTPVLLDKSQHPDVEAVFDFLENELREALVGKYPPCSTDVRHVRKDSNHPTWGTIGVVEKKLFLPFREPYQALEQNVRQILVAHEAYRNFLDYQSAHSERFRTQAKSLVGAAVRRVLA